MDVYVKVVSCFYGYIFIDLINYCFEERWLWINVLLYEGEIIVYCFK